MSVKVSTAMNSAKTIQYIIHRTWGVGGVRGQQLSLQSQLPCPRLTQRFQRACPAAFSRHLAGPRELPLRNCHSSLYPPPRSFTHTILHRHPNSLPSNRTHSA